MDWNTRLAVVFRKDGTETIISPIDSFTPTFTLNAEAIHSIERTHIGVVYSPENITFSMTVKAIGSVPAQLTALAMQGERFDIILQEQDAMGEDWAFSELVLSDCIITSAGPTAATTVGAPTATFSGFSLAASMSGKAGLGGPARTELPTRG
ncbi:MAG: hypothetical protein AAGF12_22105 [Myxococcota bacterium]